MKLPRVNYWTNRTVRFWDHYRGVNDCFGNSRTRTVKARTDAEAVRKCEALKDVESLPIRVHSVTVSP